MSPVLPAHIEKAPCRKARGLFCVVGRIALLPIRPPSLSFAGLPAWVRLVVGAGHPPRSRAWQRRALGREAVHDDLPARRRLNAAVDRLGSVPDDHLRRGRDRADDYGRRVAVRVRASVTAVASGEGACGHGDGD